MVAAGALALAAAWNLSPMAWSYSRAQTDRDANPAYWQPAIDFLNENLTPSYRVEAVDTLNHWPAVHLPRVGIPLARGWYRQDDFPQNALLYDELRQDAQVAIAAAAIGQLAEAAAAGPAAVPAGALTGPGPVERGSRRRQVPSNAGCRFSTNASTPSWKSFVRASVCCSSASRSSWPSRSGYSIRFRAFFEPA